MSFPCDMSPDWLYEQVESKHRETQKNAHKIFLTVRLIQKVYRGHRVRSALKQAHKNAIVIQRHFRGFLGRKKFYEFLENKVQQQFQAHFNRRAIIIQKWFRGFYSRKHVLDFYKYREAQRKAARELILAVAYKMHHLLRTHQIPGVYSRKCSHVLSKVEKLMASLRFSDYKKKVKSIKETSKVRIAGVKKKSLVSKNKDVKATVSLTELHNEITSVIDADIQNDMPPHRLMSNSSLDQGPYAKVVSSMERCSIIKSNDMMVCLTTIKKPEKIEQFCSEMTAICQAQNLCP